MGEVLKVIGLVIAIVGGWLIYAGLGMDVTVNTGATGEVANLQLMHMQQMNLMLGALAIIEGTICFVGGLLFGQRSPNPRPTD